jgi:hypothetical protein
MILLETMNLCIVTARFFPQLVGSGTSAFILAREIQLRGHSVTVLTDASLRGNPEHKSLAFGVRYINDFEAFATGKAGFAAALDDLYKNIVTIKPDIIHACNFMPMFCCRL